MARRSTVDGSRSSTLEPEFGSVRGMRHFAEVHGLRVPVSTDVPDSPALHLIESGCFPTRMSREQPREDQRGMEGDHLCGAQAHEAYVIALSRRRISS
ncbi:hypothetical protein EVAR_84164_1 [Eumeta japonica]|uniref:Uncharacterized protein n=1 Tax=Eumeta variegata TaxID=151549 RepID=A0A4C2A7T1_EUMVA|nr:hypothetical protein EVAR_84164_1 [Eumeta japonica]